MHSFQSRMINNNYSIRIAWTVLMFAAPNSGTQSTSRARLLKMLLRQHRFVSQYSKWTIQLSKISIKSQTLACWLTIPVLNQWCPKANWTLRDQTRRTRIDATNPNNNIAILWTSRWALIQREQCQLCPCTKAMIQDDKQDSWVRSWQISFAVETSRLKNSCEPILTRS